MRLINRDTLYVDDYNIENKFKQRNINDYELIAKDYQVFLPGINGGDKFEIWKFLSSHNTYRLICKSIVKSIDDYAFDMFVFELDDNEYVDASIISSQIVKAVSDAKTNKTNQTNIFDSLIITDKGDYETYRIVAWDTPNYRYTDKIKEIHKIIKEKGYLFKEKIIIVQQDRGNVIYVESIGESRIATESFDNPTAQEIVNFLLDFGYIGN